MYLDEPVKIGRSVARCRPAQNNATFDCKVLSRNHALVWFDHKTGKVREPRTLYAPHTGDSRANVLVLFPTRNHARSDPAGKARSASPRRERVSFPFTPNLSLIIFAQVASLSTTASFSLHVGFKRSRPVSSRSGGGGAAFSGLGDIGAR